MKQTFHSSPIGERVQAELIRSLYRFRLPALIMSIGSFLSLLAVASVSDDITYFVLAALSLFSSAFRLTVVYLDHGRASDENAPLSVLLSAERRFAVAYLQFAVVLGISCALVINSSIESFGMLAVSLATGYSAGAAVTVGLRPSIAITSMILAVVPTLVVALLRADPIYSMTAMMMAAFLFGGCRSVVQRHQTTNQEMFNRFAFQTLSRRDPLTKLPNRLRLQEWFNERRLDRSVPVLAVHCLDLNGFKPVNDLHGHPMGDIVLTMVAIRLASLLEGDDIAARLGGDEFVVIQHDVGTISEAEAFAAKLSAAIAAPYDVGELRLSISTSIGCFVGVAEGSDLEPMLSAADDALYRAKRTGRITVVSSMAPFLQVAA